MTENAVPDRFAIIVYRVNGAVSPMPKITKSTIVVPVNVADHEDIKIRNDITEKIAKDNRIRTRAEYFQRKFIIIFFFVQLLFREKRKKKKATLNKIYKI